VFPTAYYFQVDFGVARNSDVAGRSFTIDSYVIGFRNDRLLKNSFKFLPIAPKAFKQDISQAFAFKAPSPWPRLPSVNK
jgi:hypothetical protein